MRLQWTSTYASSNRLHGSLLVHKKGRKQLKASHPRDYFCSTFASKLYLCFGLDAANDEAQIHPHSFCKRCYDAMQCMLKADSESISPFQQPHVAVQVKLMHQMVGARRGAM